MDVTRTSRRASAGDTRTAPSGVAPRVQGAFGGALVALTSAAALLVGLRSVAALDFHGVHPLVRLPPIPHDALGIEWTARLVWPADLQHVALGHLAAVVVGLFLAAVGVALLNALVLLLEAGSSRRREVAVRAALGAPPGTLVRLCLDDVRLLASVALALGLLLGLSMGGALRVAWPGPLESLSGLGAAGSAAGALLAVAAVAAAAYTWVGLTLGRSAALSAELGVGERATDDPAAIFRRRALSAIQMGAAGSVAMASLALATAVRSPAPDDASVPTSVISVEAPEAGMKSGGDGVSAAASPAGGGWGAALARLSSIPGMEAESLASSGALVGLGVRDRAIAQCGACVKGNAPAPLWTTVVDHFAVTPGYFGLAGRRLVAGRALTEADGPGGPKVALVNETFARTAFENGDPLGHKVLVGHDLDSWYEVVGVVADDAPAVVGRDDIPPSQIFLSALQQAPARGDVLLRGSEDAVTAAVRVLDAAGTSPGMPRTLGALRHAQAAPLTWVAWVSLSLGVLTLLLALQGSHATALQVSRRRLRELAVRRVLGATDAGILRFVFGGAARGALWGSALAVFLGSLWVALVQRTAAGVPSPGPGAYLAMVALLVGVAVLASLKAAREALAVVPAEAVS